MRWIYFTTVSPRFRKKPKDSVAFEKEDLELECSVYGQPNPSVFWMKNGEIIIESEYFQVWLVIVWNEKLKNYSSI